MLTRCIHVLPYHRSYESAGPGTIAVGVAQSLAGKLMKDAPTVVMPFKLPRGARLPAATMALELDFLGAKPVDDVRHDCCVALLPYHGAACFGQPLSRSPAYLFLY